MKITVFTPTYNRGYIINHLYESLKRQTFKDFEWLVIDDGSTDETEKLFEAWKKEDNFFDISYQKVENGGKHRAINRGVAQARGKLFFIVDSDDYLTDNALERINYWWETIDSKEKAKFAGVGGQRGYSSEKAIGTSFSNDTGFLDITSLEREKYQVLGDKAEVFRTEILKKYPFKEFTGETFLTEATVWYLIADAGYKIRFFNEINYICNYLDDGLTKNLAKRKDENIQGELYTNKVYREVGHYSLKSSIFNFGKIGIRARLKGYSFKEMRQQLGCSGLFLRMSVLLMNIYQKLHKN